MIQTKTQAALKLRGGGAEGAAPSTAAFPELETKGYTVVPGVISPERAEHYVNEMYGWLESFGLGFNGSDRGTWHVPNVPSFDKGGLFHRYGVGHEQFAWDIRSEPGVIDVFARIWGTPELLVSYDSVNISLPYGSELSAEGGKPWPHVDQSPTRPFRHCVQGIVNLAPNGPADGGLTVLEGSTALFEEYFAGHPELAPATGWSTADTWDHAADAVKWFQDRGCKWTKVCAAPGDLILWDSRTVHYGAAAAGTEPRVATYVCYKPANQISPENLQLKNECFANSWGTSHDPVDFRVTAAHTKTHWKMEAGERVTPRLPPVLSQRARQLAGIEAY